jgi:hypothetical protein
MLFTVEAFGALAALIQRMIDMLGFVLFEFVLASKLHITMIAFEGAQIAVACERVTL